MDYLRAYIQTPQNDKNPSEKSTTLKTQEEILQEGRKYRENYKNKIPVLIVSKEKLALKREKFLVNPDDSFQRLQLVIRRQINLNEQSGLFYFIGNTLLTGGNRMGDLDKKYCTDGGFLKIIVAKENVFG